MLSSPNEVTSLEKFKNLNLNSSLKIYTMFQMSTVKIIITLYSKI